MAREKEKLSGPGEVQITIRGSLIDSTRQVLEPGEKPGTFRIVQTIIDQRARGLIDARARGIAEFAQVSITGAISGAARSNEGKIGFVMAEGHLKGIAEYHAYETDRLRIHRSMVMGSASVAARGSTAQASIACVTAIVQ